MPNENVCEPVVKNSQAAWAAWLHVASLYGATHRVYGVAMDHHGDTIFAIGPAGALDVILGGGLLARTADTDHVRLLDQCIAADRFMVCVQERGGAAAIRPIFRVFPAKVQGWSTKSLHPQLGGLGSISATVLR